MPPYKTTAFVLQLLPYRESSAIVRLLSPELGLIDGIAKGARSHRKGREPIERGLLLETAVYVKPNRTLHTLGSYSVVEFYPTIRFDLAKSAMRDAAFETALKALPPHEPSTEAFDCLGAFMARVESAPTAECFPFALWGFYYDLSTLLGFGLDLTACVACGSALTEESQGVLISSRGGVVCNRCMRADSNLLMPASVASYLKDRSRRTPPPSVPPQELKRITHLLAAYCRYHVDLEREFTTLSFLDQVFEARVTSSAASRH